MHAFTALLILTLAAPSRVPTVSAEAFDPFLAQFISNPTFRAARITTPLPVRIGTESNDGVHEERWSSQRVAKTLIVPLSPSALADNGLKQEIRRVSARVVEVFQYRDEADSYLITYRFTLRRGKWYLARLVDESM